VVVREGLVMLSLTCSFVTDLSVFSEEREFSFSSWKTILTDSFTFGFDYPFFTTIIKSESVTRGLSAIRFSQKRYIQVGFQGRH